MSNTSNMENEVQFFYRLLGLLITLATPVVLVLTAVRILLTPAFLPFEYSMLGFPQDRFGFSLQDRLHWSRFARDYLMNETGIDYLGDLKFSDGSPVFNLRELKHMADVKIVLRAAINVWYVTLVFLFVLGIWAWLGKWISIYRHGVARGGWLTVILISVIILFVLLSFGVFFVAFHNVFFDPGTWIFYYSDTLIRLFPERFWRDIFIYVGLISAVAGLTLALLVKPPQAS